MKPVQTIMPLQPENLAAAESPRPSAWPTRTVMPPARPNGTMNISAVQLMAMV